MQKIRFPTLAPYLLGELGSEATRGVGELCMCIHVTQYGSTVGSTVYIGIAMGGPVL